MKEPYPKPSSIGGTLIRKVIAQFKGHDFPLPIEEPVLISVSGGADSMVLGHLISRYGRKVIRPDRITLLHFDHAWRIESAGSERLAVKALAGELGVGFRECDLPPPDRARKGLNLEEDGRIKRLQVFDDLAGPGRPYRFVFTGHHRDDVAETLFFRFLRGEFDEQRRGVLFQAHQVLRPFLKVTKKEILAYVQAEGSRFYEDPSNQDESFFRSWTRHRVFPMLEERYPGLREVLARYAESTQGAEVTAEALQVENLVQALSGPLNRSQRMRIGEMLQDFKVGACLSLSGGIQLKRLKRGWLIEKDDQGNQA